MTDPAVSGSPGAPDVGLSRNQRLLRPIHFREAYDGGRKYVGRHMILWLRIAEDAGLRLGVVSSRRVGGAVQRNRARRRLRALYRTERPELSGRVDVVLVARATCVAAPWPELRSDFLRLTERAGLRRPSPASSAPS